MPIFDQGYQHWRGALSGHALRWRAIARQGVRQQTRRRRTKWLVAAAFVPALMLAVFLVFWGLFEQQAKVIDPFLFLVQGLPDEVREGPRAYRGAVWSIAYHLFFSVETFFAMILVLTVGPDLVSQDLRFNAVPLYFSRPIRRLDYFAGKLGVIAAFLAAVSAGPALLAYVLGVAFSLDVSVLRDTWRLAAASLAYSLVLVVSAGTLMLAVSSLSRNSRLVGAIWVGLWVVSNETAGVLTLTVREPWCPVVSYTANLGRVREELFGTATARRKFVDLYRSGRDAGREAVRPRFPFGRRRRFAPPPPPPPPGDEAADDRDLPLLLQTPDYLRQPWGWSAGVLGGLFVASAWTLSTRVKSMDRLK